MTNYNTDRQKPIHINERLVWDYEIPDDANQNESFRKWYLTRVLTRGTADDIRAIGLEIIHAYLPSLHLPSDIRDFWNWYFSLPTVRDRYGSADAIPETIT